MSVDLNKAKHEWGAKLPDQAYDDILRRLPHRPPILLLDKVDEIYSEKSAVGHKFLEDGSPYFDGHFPKRPVLPGVYLIEGMAQTAAMLIAASLDICAADRIILLLTIDKTRFNAQVTPQSHLRFEVERLKQYETFWRFSAKTRCGEQVVARSQFMAKLHD